jgi:hypothetical protein
MKVDKTKIIINGKVNNEYLYNVIKNLINTDEFKTKAYINSERDKENLTKKMMNIITDFELPEKYGDENLIMRLKYNPYAVIKQASSIAKKSELIGKEKEIQYVNPYTHKKEAKMIRQGIDNMRGQRFYNNIIKNNGLSKEFRKMAEIGIYGGHYSIVYENFKQAVGTVKRKNGNIEESGIVSQYMSKNKKIYIIEWQSTGGVEMMYAEQFKVKYVLQ